MLNIYYAEQNTEITISKENAKRITYPVEQLRKNHTLISSNECKKNLNDVKLFMSLAYSKKYINEIFNQKFKHTLCDNCTYSNSIKQSTCIMCDSVLTTKNKKNYFDNDPDTLFTSFTPNDLINTVSILINILEHESQYSYALIRPPAHHSSHDCHSGFCINI